MNKMRNAFIKTIPVMAGYLVLGLGFGIVPENHGYIYDFAQSYLRERGIRCQILII